MSVKRNNKYQIQISTVCGRFLANEISLIETARSLADYRDNFKIKNYQDILLFDEIKFETDHLPIGEQRKNWAPEALKEKDKEIKEIETMYRERAQEACKRLIAEMAN